MLGCRRVDCRKKVQSLQGIVDNLKSKNLISESCSEALEETFCGIPLQLMKRIMSKHTRAVFHPALKAFALTLQFYSTKAYNYVRETFGLGLPHICTIRRWYSSVDGNAGFSSDAFRSLELKVADARSNGGDVLCALMIDEMAIRKKLE